MPSRILRLWNPSASAWEEVGDSRLTTHLAAGDPHPQYLLETLADAKGDLLAASAADTVGRLALGTNGQVLTADSTQALGIKWAAAGGGGGVTSVDGQTGAVDLAPTYVNVSGDVMTGGLTLGTGYALTVPATATTTSGRLFGTGSGAFAPTSSGSSPVPLEMGARFTVSASTDLVEVRWYRAATTQTKPAMFRLWDAASTGAAVWTWPGASITDGGAVGWQTTAIPAGSRWTLVTGKTYTIAYDYDGTIAGNTYTNQTGYTPVPDSPLSWVGSFFTNGALSYPGTSFTGVLGIDAAVGGSGGAAPTAAAGAVRLSNATAVAWRNGANTADLALTVDSSNALVFGGSPVQTQTTSDSRYLRLTGGQLTGSLGVGVNPAAWGAAQKSVQANMASLTGSGGGASLTYNSYHDGSAWRALQTDAAFKFDLIGNTFALGNSPSASAGAAQTFTTRLAVGGAGTLTVTQDAGQAAVMGGTGTALRLEAPSPQNVSVASGGGYFHPVTDNTTGCGYSALRWTTVYATTGTINTSVAEAKTDITPLSPEDAMAAVRATTPVTFDYKPPARGPEWYELPPDPEQAEAILYQRLTAAPLEEGARHQAGVVLDSPAYPCAKLFETGTGQTNPSNGVGILIAALKSIDQRLTALETP